MTTITENLGQLIVMAREKKGMTRTKLASFTGISPNSLVKYERAGEKDGKYPSMKNMAKICDILEIDPRWPFEMLRRGGEVETTNVPDFWHYFGTKEQERTARGEEWALLNYMADQIETLNEKISAITRNEGGPDNKGPSRSKSSKTTKQAVGAASTSRKKGSG